MKSISFSSITKTETTILKALSILMIMFHNLYRWIDPKTWENEFDFNRNLVFNAFKFIYNEPLETANVLFSFLGHFGVQVFIILSSYGIMKSSLNKNIKWFKYMKNRYVKLYPSFAISVFFMAWYYFFMDGSFIYKKVFHDCLIQLTTLANFIPDKALAVVGPWWFYSLIFQIYASIPLLIFLNKKYGDKVFIIIAVTGYIITMSSHSFLLDYKLNILHTALGHLPEVCLGLWLALKKEVKIPFWIFILTLIVFIAGNFYKTAWFFSHISAGILLLFSMLWLTRKFKNATVFTNPLIFIGNISVYLFACHGFLRWKFIGRAEQHSNTLSNFLNGILFLITSITVAYILTKLEEKYRAYVVKGTSFKIKTFRLLYPLVLAGILYMSLKYEYNNYKDWNKKEISVQKK